MGQGVKRAGRGSTTAAIKKKKKKRPSICILKFFVLKKVIAKQKTADI